MTSKLKKSQRLVLATDVFYPESTATAHYMLDIAEALANSGISVKVLCASNGHEDGSRDAVRLNRNSWLDNVGIEVERISVPSGSKNRLYNRAITKGFFALKCLQKIIMAKAEFDVVAVTNPPFLVFTLALVSKFSKRRVTLIVHDVFPYNAVPAGIAKAQSPLIKGLGLLFGWSYRQMDTIVVIGRDMRNFFEAAIGVEPTRIELIANWPTLSFGDSSSGSSAAGCAATAASEAPSRRIVRFVGNLGLVQGLYPALLALRQTDPSVWNVSIEIFGRGAELHKIEKLSEDWAHVKAFGSFKSEKQVEVISDCDVALVVLAEGMYGLGVPSKAYNSMAAGKPILYLGPSESEIDCLIREHDFGWSFDWSNLEGFCDFIVYELPSIAAGVIHAKGALGRSLVNGGCSRKTALEGYVDIITGD